MKRSIFILLALLFTATVNFAQDSKVTTAAIAYDNMRLDEAIIKCREALSKPELLKPKSIAKANYYLAQSFYRILVTPDLKKKFEGQFPDLENATYDAYKKAQETVKDAGGDKGSFTAGLDFIKSNLFVIMQNKGTEIYSSATGGKDGKETPESLALLKSASGYFAKALEVDPTNYLPELVLGYISLRSDDNAGTISHLDKSITLYEDRMKKQLEEKAKDPKYTVVADSSMDGAYIQLSGIYLEGKNTVKALEIIEKGKKTFPNNADLARQELVAYQSDPSYLQQALSKFEENLKKNPKDATIRTAYADMLTRAGKPEEGIAEYKKVLESDPNNFFANANLGAHYVNTAAAVNEKMKTAGADDYEKLNAQIIENFKSAYPYIKKAQELKKDEIEWVEQMIQITSYLMIQDDKMEAEMTKYHELKKKMLGQ